MMDTASVRRREVLRYMGCKGEADPAVAGLVEACLGELGEACGKVDCAYRR